MARKRRTTKASQAPAVKQVGGLADPYPSSPTRCPLYNIYTKPTGEARIKSVQVFAATYSAKKFLDALINDTEFEWIDDNKIRTGSGLDIKSDQIHELLAHEYSKPELEWQLHGQYRDCAHRLLYGKALPQAERDWEPTEQAVPAPTPASKQSKPTKTKKSKSARVASREGLVTIAKIAKELDMTPREARGILRKTKTPKPDAGWAWSAKDAKAITKIIKKG